MRTLLICFFILTFFSCENKANKDALLDHPYGKAFNDARKEIGLPILEDKWLRKESVDQVFEEDSTAHDVVFWVPEFVDMNKPYHKYKKVIYEEDSTILSEEDVYYYYPSKERVEVVKLAYDFTADTLPWKGYFIYYQKEWKSDEISKVQAEKVLDGWGL